MKTVLLSQVANHATLQHVSNVNQAITLTVQDHARVAKNLLQIVSIAQTAIPVFNAKTDLSLTMVNASLVHSSSLSAQLVMILCVQVADMDISQTKENAQNAQWTIAKIVKENLGVLSVQLVIK